MDDAYLTLSSPSEGLYKEKGSKFFAFAFPVSVKDAVKPIIDELWKKHHDARHICFAYIIDPEKKETRANDDGEPSGTAGRPILGALQSKGVANVLVAVVRYFGGTKLGTSGLINAYRTATLDALDNGEIVERTIETIFNITFDYFLLNDVMRVVKEEAPTVISQTFDNECRMCLSIRRGDADRLRSRIEKVEGLRIVE